MSKRKPSRKQLLAACDLEPLERQLFEIALAQNIHPDDLRKKLMSSQPQAIGRVMSDLYLEIWEAKSL